MIFSSFGQMARGGASKGDALVYVASTALVQERGAASVSSVNDFFRSAPSSLVSRRGDRRRPVREVVVVTGHPDGPTDARRSTHNLAPIGFGRCPESSDVDRQGLGADASASGNFRRDRTYYVVESPACFMTTLSSDKEQEYEN